MRGGEGQESLPRAPHFPLPHTSPSPPIPMPHLSLAAAFTQVNEIAEYCAANASAIDRQGAFPVREFDRLAAAGLLSVPLLPEFGGLGLGIDASLMHET